MLILFTSGKRDEAEECTVPHDGSSRNLAKLSRDAPTGLEAVGMWFLSQL